MNIEDLNLEDITEEFLYEEAEALGEELGVDTREGSIYMDAAAGHILRTAKFFDDLRQVGEIIGLSTCSGDILTEKMTERGLRRNPESPTQAVYAVTFTGAYPTEGDRVSAGDYYFTVDKTDSGDYILISEEFGTELNVLAPGTTVIPELDVAGLESAEIGNLITPAQDIEDDDSARRRLIAKISGPAENGNKTQVKSWCEEVEGVGIARIVPLWAGPNTVQGVIVSANGGVPSEEVVENVQKYLDPGASGMGEGVATIGQHFTAIAVEAVSIQVTVDIEKSTDASYSAIQDRLEAELAQYFAELALGSEGSSTVRYTSIGARLAQISGVVDYDNLEINGGDANVQCTIYQVPVLGGVTVGEGIL